nr:DUF3667 domain-containing protein [uncultured Carboxylicivirga sp.]
MNDSKSTPIEDRYTEEINCKNCNTLFKGQYCPNCGQHIKEIERPIRFMIVDFMGTVISFDTRLIKTLVAILFKPGKLTQDFLDGKRARYMPPFRFYVFISFIMFLLISTITNKNIAPSFFQSNDDSDKISLNDSITVDKDSILLEVNKNLKETLDSSEYSAIPINLTNTDSIKESSEDFVDKMTDFSDDDIDKYKSTAKLIEEHPEIFTAKLFQYTSWSLFLIMPIFAFLLWIVFFKSKSLYIGHLIFALNIHSFLFTLTAIITGIALIFPNHSTSWAGYLYLLAPLYQTIGAKRLYKRSWPGSFFRLTLVWFLYGIIWIICLCLLFTFTFLFM